MSVKPAKFGSLELKKGRVDDAFPLQHQKCYHSPNHRKASKAFDSTPEGYIIHLIHLH